jgi:hypothetical protein
MVDICNLILMPRHNLNPTHKIRAGNFRHDLQIQHKLNMKLMGYGCGV